MGTGVHCFVGPEKLGMSFSTEYAFPDRTTIDPRAQD